MIGTVTFVDEPANACDVTNANNKYANVRIMLEVKVPFKTGPAWLRIEVKTEGFPTGITADNHR